MPYFLLNRTIPFVMFVVDADASHVLKFGAGAGESFNFIRLIVRSVIINRRVECLKYKNETKTRAHVYIFILTVICHFNV
jgi:hypothetical protein